MPAPTCLFKHSFDEPYRTQGLTRSSRVDQNQFGILVGSDLDLALAGDGDTVARAGLDTVYAHPAAGNEIEVPAWIGIDRDRFPGFHRGAEDLRIGIDGQRAVINIATGQQLERAISRLFRKRHRTPARAGRRLVVLDPDLEQSRLLVLEIVLGVRHTGPGAHYLDIAGAGAAFVAHRILMGNRAGADIG